MLSTRDSPQNKRPTQPEHEWIEKFYMQKEMKRKKKKAEVAILISDKIFVLAVLVLYLFPGWVCGEVEQKGICLFLLESI